MDHLRRHYSLLVSISFTMTVYGCAAPPRDHFHNQTHGSAMERSERTDLAPSSSRAMAVAVANQLRDPSQRANAERELIQMGPIAEPAVLPLLKDHDLFVRVSACDVLAVIGTERSISALNDVASADHYDVVIIKADATVNAIRSRMK